MTTRIASASSEDSSFVFQTKHLDELFAILRFSIAPNGRIVEPRPAPVVFAERHGLTHEELSSAIIMFAKDCDRENEYSAADDSLGWLSQLSETNTLAYLEQFSLDKRHTGNRNSALYALLHKSPSRFSRVFRTLEADSGFTKQERYDNIHMVWSFIGSGDLGFTHVTAADRAICIRALREVAELETWDRPRWWIDHALCDHLEGWKYSEDRVHLLRNWEKTQTSEHGRHNWDRIANETEEAIRTGNTEWVLYKDRPRPPSAPTNPDGSLAVPKGQEDIVEHNKRCIEKVFREIEGGDDVSREIGIGGE